MSDSQGREQTGPIGSQDELMMARFIGMVVQQRNMAMMLLGKMAHPESGKTLVDLEAARMFIDQLEMLEAKTKGNLNNDESSFLTQTLTALRIAFVESVDKVPPAAVKPEQPKAAPSESAPGPASPGAEAAGPDDDTGQRKKFSKSYGEG